MIVGVQPKDDHIAYESKSSHLSAHLRLSSSLSSYSFPPAAVDDGTAVLRILVNRKSIQIDKTLHFLTAPEPPSGIPECYRMPPQPKTSRPGYGDASSSTSTLSPPQPRFNVADVVMCVGKVQIARDGGRFIVAKSLASSRDLNDESRHQIKAVELDNNLYRQPFDWNRIQADVKASLATQPTTTSLSRPSARSLLTDASLEHGVDVLPSLAPHRDKHESIPDTRLTRDEARKLLAGDTPSPSYRAPPGPVVASCAARQRFQITA
jgi:hypothetical protein